MGDSAAQLMAQQLTAPQLTAPQRVGLGMVAFFQGEIVAAPVFALAVMFRFPSNWWMLVHHTRFTLLRLIQSTMFEGLVAAISWCVFGSLLVAVWKHEHWKLHPRLTYLAAVPLALAAPLLLAMPLWKLHQLAILDKALFLETVGYMAVNSAAAIRQYGKLADEAEKHLAAGGKFQL